MLLRPAAHPALAVTTYIYVNVSFIPSKRARKGIHVRPRWRSGKSSVTRDLSGLADLLRSGTV